MMTKKVGRTWIAAIWRKYHVTRTHGEINPEN